MRSSDILQIADDAIATLEGIMAGVSSLQFLPGNDGKLAEKLEEGRRAVQAVSSRSGVCSQLEMELTRISGLINRCSSGIEKYGDFLADRLPDSQEKAIVRELCKSAETSKSVARLVAASEIEKLSKERSQLEARQSELLSRSEKLDRIISELVAAPSLEALDKILGPIQREPVVHSGNTGVLTQVSGSGGPSRRNRGISIAISATTVAVLAILALYIPRTVNQDPRKDVVEPAKISGVVTPGKDVSVAVPAGLSPVVPGHVREPVLPVAKEPVGQCMAPTVLDMSVTDVFFKSAILLGQCADGTKTQDAGKEEPAKTTTAQATKPLPAVAKKQEASKPVLKPVDHDAAKVARQIQYKLSCREQERRAMVACTRTNSPFCALPKCGVRSK